MDAHGAFSEGVSLHPRSRLKLAREAEGTPRYSVVSYPIVLDEEAIAFWERVNQSFGILLTPIETTILQLMLKRKTVRVESLVDAVWGADPDGGPSDGAGTIRVHLVHLRKKLPGLTIVSHYGIGYETKMDWPDADRK